MTSVLNLRSGPGLGYRVITGLPYGTTVAVLDGPRAADGYHWVQVRTGRAGTGWVANAYLSAGEAPAAAAAPKAAPAPVPAASSSGSITDIIVAAANRYGQSPEAMLAVARCESNLNPRAVNPISIGAAGNNASGLFQFLPSTWSTTPYASHDIFDPWASANAAGWMWLVGRRGEWVC
ncbi:MAG: SH3 domain-containing protein [Chloroflexota bacterium]|nr:SH3 domain-containing protein [Chloroflexota bacterium]